MTNKIGIFLGILYLSGCWVDNNREKEDVFQIKVVNNSTQKVGFFFSNEYPDTSIEHVADCGCKVVEPKTNKGCLESYGWKDHINTLCKGGKLILFLFNRDTIDKYSWDTVEAKYMIMKRWELSIDDLEARNWTVTYP